MRKFFLLVIVVGLLAISLPVDAFSIRPSKILLTVDQGKTKVIPIEIINNEKKDLFFIAKVYFVKQTGEGKPEFVNNYSESEKWIIPPTNEIFVKSGDKGVANFSIQVSDSAKAGSYFLALAIQPSSGSNGVGLAGQVVSILNLQVSGMVGESLKINKWEQKINKKDKNNWYFNLDLENIGQMDVLLGGSLLVKTWGGQKLFQEKLSLGNRLLPNTHRFVRPQIDLAKNKPALPGLYIVQAQIKYGKTQQNISSSVYVWYWPFWSKVLGVCLGFVFIILLVVIIRKIKSRKR